MIEYYKSTALDRRTLLREDANWIRNALLQAESLVLPVWRDQNLVTSLTQPEPVYITSKEAGALFDLAQDMVFLGHRDGQAVFAAGFDDHLSEPSLPHGEFIDLRSVGRLMGQEDGALFAYARGLIHWHKMHRFCGRCGTATRAKTAGHIRECPSAECARLHFPRTDPAVIMAIHDGADHLLLARHPSWPEGTHSVLAGFVEPCETLEQAVAREVLEEVGLAVDKIEYRYSQPWPFPSSIMLGFFARAERNAPMTIAKNEIENAGWHHRDSLLNLEESDSFRLPRTDSIARRLVEEWLGRNKYKS